MATLHIHPPDGAAAVPVTLEPGVALLVGREPEAALVPPRAGEPPERRTLAIASPLVSSNHVLLWREGEQVRARDLTSKNGTFVRLTAEPASLPWGAEAHVYLAALKPGAGAQALTPLPVNDVGPAEFAERIKGAIGGWLSRAGLAPRLRVLGANERGGQDELDPGRFTLPLVDGLALEISDDDPSRTQVRWDALKAELFPYAHEQVTAFRTCRAARAGRGLSFASRVAEKALREVLEAAWARMPLVLTGETGTGKTELAAIYAGRESPRDASANKRAGERPFVTVHCAHLDPPLAHSLLFGALKGSFTSAERNLVGAVALADGGVLFLDDVDALPAETQAKLLRFLDHGEYEPLGHGQREPLSSQVQVVAGTNGDLRAAVRERRFREDLYWRLHAGAVVRVPALRERPEDLEQVLRSARSQTRDGERSVLDRLEPAALEHLLRKHPWRGNFRECLRFSARARLSPDPVLTKARCEAILAEATLEEPVSPPPVAAAGAPTFTKALEEALATWSAAEAGPPVSFDDLQRFCETHLKSVFVAHTLGLAGATEKPAALDREARQTLGCDLSTAKRKLDDYLALKRPGRAADEP
ncbi:MAG: sigma 54-interacting transcriptional regulator [Deltaproteobacteria bacterium]|nr:sigma 54-interacting transcriptional regulator [Deltaproteobacteria bacterium]